MSTSLPVNSAEVPVDLSLVKFQIDFAHVVESIHCNIPYDVEFFLNCQEDITLSTIGNGQDIGFTQFVWQNDDIESISIDSDRSLSMMAPHFAFITTSTDAITETQHVQQNYAPIKIRCHPILALSEQEQLAILKYATQVILTPFVNPNETDIGAAQLTNEQKLAHYESILSIPAEFQTNFD